MTSETGTDKFLEVEAEANRLIDELESLKKESESYKTAAVHLNTAGEGLSRLTNKLEEIAAATNAVVARLAEVGMPELLESQTAVSQQLVQVESGLSGQSSLLQSLMEAQSSAVEQLTTTNRILEQQASNLAFLRTIFVLGGTIGLVMLLLLVVLVLAL